MGCCGCSLYASTITAGIFTLIDCVLYLCFDIFIVIFITSTNPFNWANDPYFKFYISGFKDLKTTILVLIGLKIGLRFIWLISAIALFHGNAKEYRKLLYAWELLTVARIIFAIATSIYALVSLMEDMQILFKYSDWKTQPNIESKINTLTAKFTILVNFLELGPIWLIILIALVIFVHQRGNEIQRKKSQMIQVNNWGTVNYNQTNGQSNNTGSQLAHTQSLALEPNPLSVSKLDANYSSKTSTMSSVEPVLQVNDVITIPRVRTVIPPKDYNANTNVQTFENRAYSRKSSNASALAKRSSYLFNDSGRDLSKIPKRNQSYNYGQRPDNYGYDNRAYHGSNNDMSRPVPINRASIHR